MNVIVGSPTSTRDKANLQYVCGCKPHFINWFCKI